MNTILFPTHNPKVHLNVRPDRKDDLDVMREIWCEDVYHVADRLSDSKIIIDVGANIGAFTCYALEHASNALVIAVEPEPNNLKMLKMNVSRVDANRVDIRETAVADYEGESTIEDNAGSSVLGKSGSTVQVKRIDDILSTLGKNVDIDIFKIDIEGFEVKVLLDMSMELQNRIKFFAIEYDHDSDGFGAIVEKLSETHQVRTLGAASRGAMIYAERY
jgi:FkbM family methyltransferase